VTRTEHGDRSGSTATRAARISGSGWPSRNGGGPGTGRTARPAGRARPGSSAAGRASAASSAAVRARSARGAAWPAEFAALDNSDKCRCPAERHAPGTSSRAWMTGAQQACGAAGQRGHIATRLVMRSCRAAIWSEAAPRHTTRSGMGWQNSHGVRGRGGENPKTQRLARKTKPARKAQSDYLRSHGKPRGLQSRGSVGTAGRTPGSVEPRAAQSQATVG